MPEMLPATVRDLLALHLVPGLGPRLTAALLRRFGTAAAVLQATAGELQEVPHIGANLAGALCQAMRRGGPEAGVDPIAPARGPPPAPRTPRSPPSPSPHARPPLFLCIPAALVPP